MRGMIVAVNPDGIIGKAGSIPWRYTGDFRRFKRVTMGSTIIMGRKTWESIGSKPLPGRRNVVITSCAQLEGAQIFPTMLEAIDRTEGDVWFIGGARIYEEAALYVDTIDVTYVPDKVEHADDIVYYPFHHADPVGFTAGTLLPHEDEPALARRIYTSVAVSSWV